MSNHFLGAAPSGPDMGRIRDRLARLQDLLQVATAAQQWVDHEAGHRSGMARQIDDAYSLSLEMGMAMLEPEEPVIVEPEVLIEVPTFSEDDMDRILHGDAKGVGVLDFYADIALNGDHRVGPLFAIPAADWIHCRHREGWIPTELNHYKERLAREGRLENYGYYTAAGLEVKVNTRLGRYREQLVRVVEVQRVT